MRFIGGGGVGVWKWWEKGGSIVLLPVLNKSLCTYLTGVKCVCERSLVVSAVEWSSLCNSL